MMKLSKKLTIGSAVAALIVGGTLAWSQTDSNKLTVSDLTNNTHFHGIAIDPQDSARIYLATHHGFFAVSADGTATRLSVNTDDFMGFTPHPSDPGTLYASGHPSNGGNLGFIMSSDGGKTWRQISPGVGGPVDFHQMTASLVDSKTIFGAYAGGLQISRDGGKTWALIGPAPDRLIDLAASSVDANRLYAATQTGLMQSTDGGRTWTNAYSLKRPTSMVEVTSDGAVYAFVVGTGLIRADESDLGWKILASSWGENYLLHLAADPKNGNILYAVAGQGGIVTSKDGGRTWGVLGVGSSR